MKITPNNWKENLKKGEIYRLSLMCQLMVPCCTCLGIFVDNVPYRNIGSNYAGKKNAFRFRRLTSGCEGCLSNSEHVDLEDIWLTADFEAETIEYSELPLYMNDYPSDIFTEILSKVGGL